jgi:hypothetical protein
MTRCHRSWQRNWIAVTRWQPKLVKKYSTTSCGVPYAGNEHAKLSSALTSASPAGTVITVRLASAVGSKTSNTGNHFNATIATPVESGGKVVLPKGAEVLRVHRGEGDCPPRRVRPHLHTHRTRHRQHVTIVLSESPASTKKPPHGRLFHRKFQTTPRNLRDL